MHWVLKLSLIGLKIKSDSKIGKGLRSNFFLEIQLEFKILLYTHRTTNII